MGSKKEIMDANQDCYTHFSNCSLPADLIKSLEEISQVNNIIMFSCK